MEAAARFKSPSQSTHLAPPRICDCYNSLLEGFDLVIQIPGIWPSLSSLWMRAASHSFSALVKTRAHGNQRSHPLACLHSLPCSHLLKWTLKAKETNILDYMIFSHLFSCLIGTALTDSRNVSVAFNYFQKNANYQCILSNANCVALKRQWLISQHWPALLGTHWHPPLYHLTSFCGEAESRRLGFLCVVCLFFISLKLFLKFKTLNYFSTWSCLVLYLSILSCKMEAVKVYKSQD